MLKQRLIFGIILITLFFGIIIGDGWLDGSVSKQMENKPIQGTGLCILAALVVAFAVIELSRLASHKGYTIFNPVVVIFTMALCTSWYWPQVFNIDLAVYITLTISLALMAVFANHYLRFETANTIANCGVNLFAIVYLGVAAAFFLALRIDYGLWAFVMFITVIKCVDIGAYSIGTKFGKTKFSPKISPNKSWEGMAGGIVLSTVVSVAFALVFDIMHWISAVIFAVIFAFVGQLGDLAESMIKRDAHLKDSSSVVPGFGGILDVIDSPLLAAPLAYVFFMIVT